jgi:hypothetical protein
MAGKQLWRTLAAVILAASCSAWALAAPKTKNENKPGSGTTTTTTSTSDSDSTTVDQGGYPNSVAVDSSGRPCTAYFAGKELKFAVFDGSSWRIQSLGLVGGDYGATSVSLAVSGQGQPAIAFSVPWVNGVNVHRLWVAWFDGTRWNMDLLDSGSFSPSMAFGADDSKLVAYTKSATGGNILNLAKNSGSGWTISTVENTPGGSSLRVIYGPSMAVDSLGYIGISYGLDISNVLTETRYAYGSPGAWNVKTLVSDVAYQTSVAFDAATNRPRVAFWARLGGFFLAAANGSGGWDHHQLPWAGTSTPGQIFLGIDPLGVNYVSAYDPGAADLHLISGTPGAFTTKVLASSGVVGKSNSLRVNRSTGEKALTFSDQSVGVLKYMSMQ